MLTGDIKSSEEIGIHSISIGFDAKRAFYNKSGLGNYSRNLLYALADYYPQNTYWLFTPGISNRLRLENEERFNIVEPGSFLFRMFPSIWRSKYMKRDIEQHRLSIFHGLSQELPFGIEKTGIRSVVTVHDLIFMRYPEFYGRIDAGIYKQKLIKACNSADHIVAISSQTKSDLTELLDVSPDKISVILQSCNRNFWKSQDKESFNDVKLKYNLPDQYLLYVGTIEERKNLLGIIKAMQIKKINLPLVAVGRKAEPYYGKVSSYITENKIRNVIFPEKVLNEELPAIYQNAECFIYPSLYEGFGIPVLEAVVSGTPVITSRDGCFPEAGGPGSIYVNPLDHEEMGEAILRVVSDTEERNKMINIGRNYSKKFTHDVIAGNYMKLYQSLI
ncbi:MAG: glycosyltransferase family 4 protein [Methanosarcina sp.]